jgi:hypothetical protein
MARSARNKFGAIFAATLAGCGVASQAGASTVPVQSPTTTLASTVSTVSSSVTSPPSAPSPPEPTAAVEPAVRSATETAATAVEPAVSSTTETVSKTVEPIVRSTTEPVTKTVEPTVHKTTEPVTKTVEPTVRSTTEPVTKTVEPTVHKTTEPVTKTVEPTVRSVTTAGGGITAPIPFPKSGGHSKAPAENVNPAAPSVSTSGAVPAGSAAGPGSPSNGAPAGGTGTTGKHRRSGGLGYRSSVANLGASGTEAIAAGVPPAPLSSPASEVLGMPLVSDSPGAGDPFSGPGSGGQSLFSLNGPGNGDVAIPVLFIVLAMISLALVSADRLGLASRGRDWALHWRHRWPW